MMRHEIRFPGESPNYRQARDALLEAELELRRKLEEVAALRRQLPLGGEIPGDYEFSAGEPERAVRLSELFAPGKDSLILYSYMFGPQMEAPCPLCTSMLDGLDGQIPHAERRINIGIVAKSPLERIHELARSRGWRNLRLLSAANNSYQRDYHGETESGVQMPTMNVFVRRAGKVHHFWSSEVLFCRMDDGFDARHIDLFWPLWHLFDLTPEGRGSEYPKLTS